MTDGADAGTIRIRIVADDEFSGTFDKATDKSKQAGGAIGKVGDAASGAVGKLVALGAAFLTVRGSIEGFNIALVEAQENAAADAFEKLGGDIDKLSGALRGLVTNDDIVKIGNYGRSMGLAEDQIEALAETAQQTSRVMGIDSARAFELLAQGVATGNARLLRQAGLMIDVQDANEDFARSIGTTGDKLNEAGQQMAMFNRVMEEQANLHVVLGDETNTDAEKLERFKKHVDDLGDAMKGNLIPIFTEAADMFDPLLVKMTKFVEEFGILNGLAATLAHLVGRDVHIVGSDEAARDAQQANLDADFDDMLGGSMGAASVTNAPKKKKFTRDASADDAKKAADHLQDLANALRDLRAAAQASGAGSSLGPLLDIRATAEKAIDDFTQKFGDAATVDQIGEAWASANEIALGEARGEISRQIEEGTIASWEGLIAAAEAAGFSVEEFGVQVSELGRASTRSANDISDIMDRFHNTGMYAGGDAGRGAGGLEGQFFEMLAGGNSVGDAATFDAMSTASSGLAGLATGGLSGLGVAIGTAAGGPIGAVVGGSIVEAGSEIASMIADAISAIVQDSRFGAAGAGAFAGAYAASPGLVLAPVGALAGAFMSLSTQTKSYERVQAGFSTVLDNVVASLEPFWEQAGALVGLFDLFGRAFSSVVAPMIENESVFYLLFEAARHSGIILGSVGLVSAALYDAFVWLAAAASYVAMVMKTGDFDAAQALYDAILDDFSINLESITWALGELTDLTYEDAKATGDNIMAQEESTRAMNNLTDSVINGPAGFRVEAYRFGAQTPSPNNGGGAGAGAGAVGLEGTGWGIIVEGDLVIEDGGADTEQLRDAVAEAAERRAGQNTGNPQNNSGPSPWPWRTPKGGG